MATLTGSELMEECGADQLCGGTKAGIEGAVRAVTRLFEEDNGSEGVLLVDASNAFNSLSRPLALWNARILWPRCARFLFNTYRGYPKTMFRQSQTIILSREGTTQGDPLGMLMYAVGTLPLIRLLKSSRGRQSWYADDSACTGSLSDIQEWLAQLKIEGPKWGYYPEPNKSYLIVKPGQEEEARRLFPDLRLVSSHRYLGGVIGSSEATKEFVREKVMKWVSHVESFAECAPDSPQATYTAFVKSLQKEWAYLQRVVQGCSPEYEPLRDAIRHRLTPAILGWAPSEAEHNLLSLPVKLGGMALEDPVPTAAVRFDTSRRATVVLASSIFSGADFSGSNHLEQVTQEQTAERARRKQQEAEKSNLAVEALEASAKRTIRRVIEGNASQWLSKIPLAADGLDLSPMQFKDAVCMRYGKPLLGLRGTCDGCGADMDMLHALNCKRGGLVKQGHDQIRDVVAGLARQAFGGVTVEPVMREGTENEHGLVADIKVNGMWNRERASFYDIRVINADASTYSSRDWTAVADEAARAKHRKYDAAAEDLHGSFSPLITSCEGVLQREFLAFNRRLVDALADKWDKPRSQIAEFVRTKLQMATIRAVSLRLRGSRKAQRSATRDDQQQDREEAAIGLEDGAPLPLLTDE